MSQLEDLETEFIPRRSSRIWISGSHLIGLKRLLSEVAFKVEHFRQPDRPERKGDSRLCSLH